LQQRKKIVAVLIIILGVATGLFIKHVKVGLILGLILGLLSSSLITSKK
jgi:hypothetical protein